MYWLATFNVVATIVFGWLAVHPFTTYPASLWVLRWIRACPRAASIGVVRPKKFAIAVCAYNEEKTISSKLLNLTQIQERFGHENIVVYAYNDCSNDATLHLLLEHRGNIHVLSPGMRAGKSFGINTILESIDRNIDIVIFTDANVILSPEVIPAFADAFCDPRVGAVCGHLMYVNANTATASVGTSYWRLEEWIKQLESDTGSVIGADGSLFAIRRCLFRTVPVDIIDDFFTSMSILCDGYRVVRSNEAKAFEASADNSNDEFRRKIRIACRVHNCHRLLLPRLKKMDLLNKYKYISHKFIRWFVMLWILSGIITFVFSIMFIWGIPPGVFAIVSLLTLVSLIWIFNIFRIPVLCRPWEVLRAFWGTLLGVICSIRGMKFQTWEPAASTREHVLENASNS